MQVSDREQFEAHFTRLYGGYNMPVSKARMDAYFSGLAKMPLSQFAKCVDHCLGEGGPEKVPSVPAMWGIRKKLMVAAEPPPAYKEIPDHLEHFANRLLLDHIRSRGGLGSQGTFVPAHGLVDCRPSAELEACMKLKRELVEFYQELILENSPHANPSSFVEDWAKQLSAVSRVMPGTLAMYTRFISGPKFKSPFPVSMARKLA